MTLTGNCGLGRWDVWRVNFLGWFKVVKHDLDLFNPMLREFDLKKKKNNDSWSFCISYFITAEVIFRKKRKAEEKLYATIGRFFINFKKKRKPST